MFLGTIDIALFTDVSTVPWERCQTVTHLLYKPSATCSSTIMPYNLKVLFFTVSLLNLHWGHRAEPLVLTLAWTFHTLLPRALLNLDVCHFLLFTAVQSDPGKRPVSSCCVPLSDLQKTLLPLRKKAQSQVPVLQRVTQLDDLLSLTRKGKQSIPFPFILPS